MNNGWDKYQVHVLTSLDELKKDAKEHRAEAQAMALRVEQIHGKIEKYAEKQRLESRIMNGILAIAVAIWNLFMGHHH